MSDIALRYLSIGATMPLSLGIALAHSLAELCGSGFDMGLDPRAGLRALPLRLSTMHYLRARQYLRNFDVGECRNDTFINHCPYRFRALQPVGRGIGVDDIQQPQSRFSILPHWQRRNRHDRSLLLGRSLPSWWAYFSLLSSSSRINVLRYVYTRLGISSGTALLLLFASLFGSYINIPVWEFPEREVRSGQEVIFFGMHYVVPVVIEWPSTVVAVNVGGAVMPTLLSLYLLFKNHLWIRGIVATALVAVIVYMLAYPVQGVGIAVPIFVRRW